MAWFFLGFLGEIPWSTRMDNDRFLGFGTDFRSKRSFFTVVSGRGMFYSLVKETKGEPGDHKSRFS